MKTTRKLFLLAALAAFAGACVVNVEEIDAISTAGNEERLVTLALSVPGIPASRGLTADEEDEVNTIDVLLFNTGNDCFYYRAVGDIDKVSKKKFAVKLPTGTWNVVVLANARGSFANFSTPSLKNAAILAPVGSTFSRAAVLDTLVLQLADETSKWPEGGFEGIPMWGYSDGLAINASTPATAATIDLTRAITRVNVSVVDDDASDGYDVTTVFSLASVRLYNYSRAGSLAPAVSGAGYDVALPNLPALGLLVDDATPLKVTEPLVYDVPAGQKHNYSGEIYTFEAAAGAGTTLSTNTCLVIGGYYNGVLSYYRVEFAKGDGTYLPLLRNHSYNVKIKEVIAAGYASETEAFDNKPSNIVVEVSEEDGTFGLVAFDDQNYLGTSAGELVIERWANAGHRFPVITDVTAGWEVVGTSGSSELHEGFELDWLTVTASSSDAGGKGEVVFEVEENDGDARRVGYIHLVAGRLHLAVKVVQRVVAVWITGASELVFEPASGAFTGQTFRVHWLPAGARVSAASIPRSGYPAFAYDPGDDVPGVGALASFGDPSGEKEVTFCPALLTGAEIAANPYVVKASFARFIAFHDDDFASTDIEARQINYHIAADVNAAYALNSDYVQTFIARGNTAWAVKPGSLQDPELIVHELNPSGDGNITGEEAPFKLVSDEAKDGQTATFTLHDPTGLAGDVSVTITATGCGINGVPVTKHIGDGDYLTHAYGDKCWMVQNSKEGTPSYRYYRNDPSYERYGCYYSYTRATTGGACPTGWHVPTNGEFSVMKTAITNNMNDAISRWWCGPNGAANNAFAGCYSGTEFGDAGSFGYWWEQTAGYNRHYTGASTYFSGPNPTPSWNFSVRCVRD